MKVTICIPTLANRKSMPYLINCVKTIRENSKEAHDIKVMVNGEHFPTFVDFPAQIFYRRQQGQCGAVNALAKEVQTEWMMVTDDDSMFPPNWERIFEHTDNHEVLCMNSMESGKIGAAPPFVVNDCGKTIETFDEAKFDVDSALLGEDKLEKGFSFPFLMKTSLWGKIGGYDEEYDPWGSNCDSDLFYKLKLAGITPMRDRRILNYHFSQISGTFDDEQKSYWMRNRSYFESKWGFRRADSPAIWYDVSIPYKELKYRPEWAVIPKEAS